MKTQHQPMKNKIDLCRVVQRISTCVQCMLFASLWLGVSIPVFAEDDGLISPGFYLRLKDEAEVPALEQGVLSEIRVGLGDEVQAGDVLATLDNKDARLTVQLAKIDLEIAESKETDSVVVDIAKAALDEAAKLLDQSKSELSISQAIANSDIAIRQSALAEKLAKEELERAQASKREFATSISDLELARLSHKLAQSQLDIESAQHDQKVYSLRSESSSALVEKQQVARQRLELELHEVQQEQVLASLSKKRSKVTLDVAEEMLARRQICSPISGIVAAKHKHIGEWVTSGEAVLRVVRIDKLLVEGYLDLEVAGFDLRGKAIQIRGVKDGRTVMASGTVIFVSPEVDSVNRQVQVQAEIDNSDLIFRPGEPVEFIIPKSSSVTSGHFKTKGK